MSIGYSRVTEQTTNIDVDSFNRIRICKVVKETWKGDLPDGHSPLVQTNFWLKVIQIDNNTCKEKPTVEYAICEEDRKAIMRALAMPDDRGWR